MPITNRSYTKAIIHHSPAYNYSGVCKICEDKMDHQIVGCAANLRRRMMVLRCFAHSGLAVVSAEFEEEHC